MHLSERGCNKCNKRIEKERCFTYTCSVITSSSSFEESKVSSGIEDAHWQCWYHLIIIRLSGSIDIKIGVGSYIGSLFLYFFSFSSYRYGISRTYLCLVLTERCVYWLALNLNTLGTSCRFSISNYQHQQTLRVYPSLPFHPSHLYCLICLR